MADLIADAAPAVVASEPAPVSTPSPVADAPAAINTPDTPKEDPAASEAALEDDLRKVWAKSALKREDDGKFAAADGKEPAKPADATVDPKTAVVDPAKPVEKLSAQTVSAPDTVSAALKSEWGKLPPAAQKAIADREAEFATESRRLGEATRAFQPITDVMASHDAYLQSVSQQAGKSAPQFMNELLHTAAALDRDPIGSLKQLAKIYRVEPYQLIDDPNAPRADPAVAEVRGQVARLQQELNQYRTQEQSVRAQADAQTHDGLVKQINEFAKDKPDFDSLKPDIKANFIAIRESDPSLSISELLSKSYERARWGNPVSRAAMQKDLQTKADADRVDQAKKDTEKAKAAASINVQGARPSQSVHDDLDAVLGAVYRKHNTR